MTYFVFDAVSFIFFLAGAFFQASCDVIHFLPRRGVLLHDFCGICSEKTSLAILNPEYMHAPRYYPGEAIFIFFLARAFFQAIRDVIRVLPRRGVLLLHVFFLHGLELEV